MTDFLTPGFILSSWTLFQNISSVLGTEHSCQQFSVFWPVEAFYFGLLLLEKKFFCFFFFFDENWDTYSPVDITVKNLIGCRKKVVICPLKLMASLPTWCWWGLWYQAWYPFYKVGLEYIRHQSSFFLFTIARKWKYSKCPLTDEWITKCGTLNIHLITNFIIIYHIIQIHIFPLYVKMKCLSGSCFAFSDFLVNSVFL